VVSALVLKVNHVKIEYSIATCKWDVEERGRR